jgi:hypothetical protein
MLQQRRTRSKDPSSFTEPFTVKQNSGNKGTEKKNKRKCDDKNKSKTTSSVEEPKRLIV